MFKNSYQSGLLSIFYSGGSSPLTIWDTHVENGHIKRVTDKEVNAIVLEIVSTNVATTYIACPKKGVLGVRLPFLVMILKNLKRYFSFEITILDDRNMRRRFRISNFQSTTKIKPFCTSMPIGLSGGWNQIQFNLSDFTKRAYGSQFLETLRVQVHANTRLRRIYFSDRLYTEEQLPRDYKLYLPLEKKTKKTAPKEEKIKTETPIPNAQKIITETIPTELQEVPLTEKVPSLEEMMSLKGSAVSITPAVTEINEEKSVEDEHVNDTADINEETREITAADLITDITADELEQADVTVEEIHPEIVEDTPLQEEIEIVE